MRRVVVILMCLAALCVTAAPALAANPTKSAYGGQGSGQLSQVQNASSTDASAKTLPFTGLNVGVVAVLAIVLTGSGLVLRRRTDASR